MDKPKILKILDWMTPATKYPLKKYGSARIVRIKYTKGFYLMEGVAGYDYMHVENKIPVTSLKINNETVMVDEPSHWLGMKKLAEKSKGNVLVCGLGLGLVVHALIENHDVRKIDVVELNKDVITLIQPLLPTDNRLFIYNDNAFDKKWLESDYDTIILDLWVRNKNKVGLAGLPDADVIPTDLLSAFAWFKLRYQKSNVYVWGMYNKDLNPAVEKEPIYLKRREFTKNKSI
jgi:hypothetical protein